MKSYIHGPYALPAGTSSTVTSDLKGTGERIRLRLGCYRHRLVVIASPAGAKPVSSQGAIGALLEPKNLRAGFLSVCVSEALPAGQHGWESDDGLLGFNASRLRSFLAFCLLGFSPSRLLGSSLLGFSPSSFITFSASRLLGISASRLLGFSASRLLGFSASRLLGFSASRLLGFSASRLLGY